MNPTPPTDTPLHVLLVNQPDVILMELVMPQLDGFSACRLLQADPATRHIPIIFLTAKNEPDERLRGLQLGGVDYVSKPIFAEEVIARIRIHLNRLRLFLIDADSTQPNPH